MSYSSIFSVSISGNAQFKNANLHTQLASYKNIKAEGYGFTNVEIGIGLFDNFWLSPEIAFHTSFGSLEESFPSKIEVINADLQTRFSTQAIRISPKFTIGKIEENVWWVLQPKYIFGTSTIKVKDEFFSKVENVYISKEIINSQEPISYFSLNVGLEGYLSESQKTSLAFFVTYTSLNPLEQLSSTAINPDQIDMEQGKIHTLGIGIQLYFHPFRKN